mgnify:CR=1 FL=1
MLLQCGLSRIDKWTPPLPQNKWGKVLGREQSEIIQNKGEGKNELDMG